MNYIFGSGIVGVLAKIILGPSWQIVPFYKSRFFSFNPALDDNFIIVDDDITPFLKDLLKRQQIDQYIYKRAWSVRGHLYDKYDKLICGDWFGKIFGQHIPPQSEAYYLDRMHLPIYDIRTNQLYMRIIDAMRDGLKQEASKGQVTEIGSNYFIRGGVREEFEHLVSTIPLNALLKLSNNNNAELPSKTLHYTHVETDDLDFEGCNQVMVVDRMFPFYKVTNISPKRYLFYFNDEIVDPGIMLMHIVKKFEILDGTSIRDALPVGPAPNMKKLEESGIYCVGSCAQWDWCMDVSSCILRLLRYANRGLKPKQPKELKLRE